jgi:hypothetical protein
MVKPMSEWGLYETPQDACPFCGEKENIANEDGPDDLHRLPVTCHNCGYQWHEPDRHLHCGTVVNFHISNTDEQGTGVIIGFRYDSGWFYLIETTGFDKHRNDEDELWVVDNEVTPIKEEV